MSVSTRPVPVRELKIRIPVPVSVIPGSEVREIQGACILSEHIADVLAPLVDKPGFIGFKTELTGGLTELLIGPYAHLLYDNVTRDGVAEIGIFGQVQGPLINWDRKVYVMSEESELLEPVFEIPFGAEVWVCSYVTEATTGSLMGVFYTHNPDDMIDG